MRQIGVLSVIKIAYRRLVSSAGLENIMNERVLYNAQKAILEEVKQELLKKADTERQRNIIKETCNSVARKHKFDDMR